MSLQDYLIVKYGWYGELFSPDKRYCRVDIHRGKSSFVPFRLLSRLFMRSKSVPVNDVFRIGQKVRFLRELAMDDVFPGCVLAPPSFNGPPANILDFPFEKILIVSQNDPTALVVFDEDNELPWALLHTAFTAPSLVEVVE